jgi:hypothetical protein
MPPATLPPRTTITLWVGLRALAVHAPSDGRDDMPDTRSNPGAQKPADRGWLRACSRNRPGDLPRFRRTLIPTELRWLGPGRPNPGLTISRAQICCDRLRYPANQVATPTHPVAGVASETAESNCVYPVPKTGGLAVSLVSVSAGLCR